MKYLFLAILSLLITASVFQYLTAPDLASEVPVLYWVTDPNPARDEQIRLFHEWLAKNHPDVKFEVRLEAAGKDKQKLIIQGVSGVAADIMDMTGMDLDYMHAIGMIDDVTQDAKRMGFDPSHTYRAVESLITLQGRQYLFPGNVWGNMLVVNKNTFSKHGQPVPKRRMSFEEFEAAGKAFVAAAHKSNEVQKVFFVNTIDRTGMRQSLGLSTFNETLTRCMLDDPRSVEVLRLIYKWTYEDRIMPTLSDAASFSTAAGAYGGAEAQLFNSGNYAMCNYGRHLLIQLRAFEKPVDVTLAELPNGGYPNQPVGVRATGIYKGSKHKDLARYFLAYLASEEYNMNLVRDADSLPPNPTFTQRPEYLSPAAYPNEGDIHAAFDESYRDIGVAYVVSPFVLYSVTGKIEEDAFKGMMSNRYNHEEAALRGAQAINREIERTLAENKALAAEYARRLPVQQKIDQLVAIWKQIGVGQSQPPSDLIEQARAIAQNDSGKIPLDWIDNVFHRKYYQDLGWAE